MTTWRLKIRPTSLQLTPWQADTVFGSLCWGVRHRRGVEELQRFLQPFKEGNPSFLLSDAFPTGYLPLPFTRRIDSAAAAQSLNEYRKQKLIKKVSLLSEDQFAAACRGEPVVIDEDSAGLFVQDSQLHASINRATGTTTPTDESGAMSLFQLNGHILNPSVDTMSIFIRDRSGDSIDFLFALFKDMEKSGFGKKKSIGMGAFQIESEPEAWEPPSLGGGNGFVSFSSFVPKKDDPTIGLWQIKLKHGKLGESYAVGGSPFKKPWLSLTTGSCLYTGEAPREVYGRMLEHLSAQYPEVVQYGYAFPVPIRFEEELVKRIA